MPAAAEISRIEVPSKPFSRKSLAETRSNSSRRLLSLLRRPARGFDFVMRGLDPRIHQQKSLMDGLPGQARPLQTWARANSSAGEPRQIGRRLDLHAQQLRGARLAEIVHAQRPR